MHGAMRRMPAEQARHAKRLGHVQAGYRPVVTVPSSSGSSNTTTAATSVTPVTTTTSTAVSTSHTSASTTSTTRSSESSAPSSSLATLSLPSSPSSSPSSAALSTPTAPATDAASLTTLTSISPSSSALPQSGAAADGLSTGALAGIIASGVIVGVALIVFFIRKTYLRRRERRRVSWTGAPGLGTGSLDERKHFPEVNEPFAAETTPRSAPISPFDPRGQSKHYAPVSPGVAPTTLPTYSVPTPLSATYNNAPIVAYPNLLAPPAPSTYGLVMPRASSGLGASSMHPYHAPMPAVVLYSFVPSLPDELSITTGERIFIIEQYDDGWNLCANGRGERGMVPRECLDATPPDQLDIGWRNAKRMSSLDSDGMRY